MTLTTYDISDGGRMVGSFSAEIEGDQTVGTEDDPIQTTVTGTITGSFDVPVL